MKAELTDKERETAELNFIPQPPVKNELGGGVYFTCHWVNCGENLKRWYNYCPKCGQKIDWEGAD